MHPAADTASSPLPSPAVAMPDVEEPDPAPDADASSGASNTQRPAPPSVVSSDSIHPQAYPSPAPAELVDTELSDRQAASRELIAHCEAELERSTDRGRRARLHYECARLYEYPLGDLRAAHEHYWEAQALRPRHVPTISGLRRVLVLSGEWEAALQVLSQEAALAETPDERAALHFERALILEECLARGSEARDHFSLVVRQSPGDAAAQRALARAARRAEDHAGLRRVLEAQASLAEDDRALLAARLSERARVAELHPSRGDDPTTWYERAFDAEATGSAALLHAVRLLLRAQRFGEAAELEERSVELLTDPRLRTLALSTAADLLAEHGGDLARSIALLERAAAESPSDATVLEHLTHLYERTGDHEGTVRTLERLDAVSTDDRQRLEVRLVLSDIHQTRRRDPATAITWLHKARELDPRSAVAAMALAGLYRELGDWQALAAELAAQQRTTDDVDLRVQLHVELADLHERRLANVETAIEHHKAVLGLCPTHQGAFRGLVRLLHRERRHHEVVELHERAAELAADDTEAIHHLLEAALIHEDLLGAPAAALSAYERVLALDATHLGALRGAQRLAEATDDAALAVELLQQETALATDDRRKIELMLRAAELCERVLEDEARALSLLEEIRALDPAYRPTLAALARIHRRAGRYGDLVAVLEHEADLPDSPAAHSQKLLVVARMVEDHLADRDLALQYYERAYALEPSDRTAHALERSLAAAGCFEELAAHLSERLASLAPDEAHGAAVELGRIRELILRNDKEALLSYDHALALEPESLAARLGRMRCLGRLGEALDLVEEAGRLADLTDDPAVRLWYTLLAAELSEGELDQPEQATALFRQVLAQSPGHRGALVALERLGELEGRTKELGRVLAEQSKVITARAERIASLRELSRVMARRRSGMKLRKEASLAILRTEPDDPRALLDLELLALTGEDTACLAEVDVSWIRRSRGARRAAHRTRLAEALEATRPAEALEQHLSALEDDAENVAAARGMTRLAGVSADVALMCRAAEAEGSVVGAPARASALLRRAAEHERTEGRGREAAAILQRALAVHPDDPRSARALESVMLELGEVDELISVLTTAARAATDPEVAAGHWILVARLLASARKDTGAAIAALARVVKSQPDHAPTLLELAELYIHDRQWDSAAECLRRALDTGPDAETTTAARLRLAELYHEHLERTDDAAALLRDVRRDAPAAPGALRRLLAIEIETQGGDAEAAAEAWVESSSGFERAEALTTLGRLQRDAGKLAAAQASLGEAVALSGLVGAGADRDLVRMFEKQEQAGESADWPLYARSLSTFCQARVPTEHKTRAMLELARLLLDRLNRPDDGYATLAAGLALAPRDLVLQQELAERLTRARHFRRALPELYKLLELAPARTDTWKALAQTFEALGKNEEAHLTIGPLVLLDAASELQRSVWSSRKTRAALVSDRSVDANTVRAALSAGGAPDGVLGLMAQLSSFAPKFVDAGLEARGLTPKDRIAARTAHPLRSVLDRVTRAFGAPDVDLYIAREGTVSLVLTEPLGIVVPASFSNLTEAQQVFCFARHLASCSLGSQVLTALGPQQTELLLAAAASVAGVPLAARGFDAERIAETGRRLAKAVPWLSKGRFEEAVQRYLAERPEDLPPLLHDLDRAALRVALVLADDVYCLALVQSRGASLLGLAPAAVEPTTVDLLTFWISPQAMTVRKKIGLS